MVFNLVSKFDRCVFSRRCGRQPPATARGNLCPTIVQAEANRAPIAGANEAAGASKAPMAAANSSAEPAKAMRRPNRSASPTRAHVNPAASRSNRANAAAMAIPAATAAHAAPASSAMAAAGRNPAARAADAAAPAPRAAAAEARRRSATSARREAALARTAFPSGDCSSGSMGGCGGGQAGSGETHWNTKGLKTVADQTVALTRANCLTEVFGNGNNATITVSSGSYDTLAVGNGDNDAITVVNSGTHDTLSAGTGYSDALTVGYGSYNLRPPTSAATPAATR